jgi:hypothetical protein
VASGDSEPDLARFPNHCGLGGRERSPNSTPTNHWLSMISWKVTFAGAAEAQRAVGNVWRLSTAMSPALFSTAGIILHRAVDVKEYPRSVRMCFGIP